MKTIDELKQILNAKQLYTAGVGIADSLQKATTPLTPRETLVVTLLSMIDRMYSDELNENQELNILTCGYPTCRDLQGMVIVGMGTKLWFNMHNQALIAAQAKYKAFSDNEKVAERL